MSFRVYGDDSSEARDDPGRPGMSGRPISEEEMAEEDLPTPGRVAERNGAAYSIKASRSHDYSGEVQPTYANGRTQKG